MPLKSVDDPSGPGQTCPCVGFRKQMILKIERGFYGEIMSSTFIWDTDREG
jgi:hypothetical protein